jgi:hypothetical protein
MIVEVRYTAGLEQIEYSGQKLKRSKLVWNWSRESSVYSQYQRLLATTWATDNSVKWLKKRQFGKVVEKP